MRTACRFDEAERIETEKHENEAVLRVAPITERRSYAILIRYFFRKVMMEAETTKKGP
jgi:hypothetical protein